MTDVQLYLTLGLPIVAVLTSLSISLIQTGSLRGSFGSLRSDFRELREEFSDLRKDVNTSLAEIRREAREDRLQISADIRFLIGKVDEFMAQE